MPAILVAIGLISTLTACFGSHGTEEDGGGPPPSDGGVGTDGGRRDAGRPHPPRCPEADIGIACLDHIVEGRPHPLEVAIGGDDACYCGETIECVANVSAEDHVVELSTGLCTDGALCDACFPFITGTCDLPPLTSGRWTVLVNGSPSFEVSVASPDLLPERAPSCIRGASDGGECGIRWPAVDGTPSFVCHPEHAYPGTRVPIDVTDGCGGCGALAGPCEVQLLDDTLHVRPSTVWSGCDVDCPAICVPREDRCWAPPLEAGSYRIVVEGLDGYESRLNVGTPREPVDPATVCGPAMATTTDPAPSPAP